MQNLFFPIDSLFSTDNANLLSLFTAISLREILGPQYHYFKFGVKNCMTEEVQNENNNATTVAYRGDLGLFLSKRMYLLYTRSSVSQN